MIAAWRRVVVAAWLAFGLTGLAAAKSPAAPLPPLRPAGVVLEGLRDQPQMVFGHYTFAVMWLPGLCQSWSDIATVCAAQLGKPAMREFTLHGLWPSRPRELVEQAVIPVQWWRTARLLPLQP